MLVNLIVQNRTLVDAMHIDVENKIGKFVKKAFSGWPGGIPALNLTKT